MLQFSWWWGWQLLTTFLNIRTKDCAILCRRSSVRSRDPSAACSPVQTPSGHLAHSARGTPAMAPWVQLGLKQTRLLSDWCKFSVTLILLPISAFSLSELQNNLSGRDHWGKPLLVVSGHHCTDLVFHLPDLDATAFYTQDPSPSLSTCKIWTFLLLTGYCGKITYVWKHVQSLPSPELRGLLFWYRWCGESQWIFEHCWCPL